MYSSRMRTVRLLTVSHSIPCILGGGGGLPNPSRCRPHWMQTLLDADPPGCRSPLDADPLVMWPVMHAGKPTPLSMDKMTDTCENITLPQTEGVWLGGVCVQGVSAQGVCVQESVHPQLHAGIQPPPPWTEWQTGVKTLPSRSFVCGR